MDGKKYTLWSPDVWGNPEDGWEVNDRVKLGEVELSDPEEEREVITDLISQGYLTMAALVSVRVDAEGWWPVLWVEKATDGMPLYELVPVEEGEVE